MDEDIQKAIDQVIKQHEQDRRKVAIEAYIQDIVTNMRISIRAQLMMGVIGQSPEIRMELERWAEVNQGRFSLQIGEVISILLRKELLGE